MESNRNRKTAKSKIAQIKVKELFEVTKYNTYFAVIETETGNTLTRISKGLFYELANQGIKTKYKKRKI